MRIAPVAALALALAASAAAFLAASPPEGEARKRIVDMAQSFQGVPYVYGASSPSAFDCSGFVQYVYAHAAQIDIPRNSRGQWAAGMPIEKDRVKPGDIFVFDTTGAGGPSHVAIFMGDRGMIHAVSEGPRTGVVISPLTDRYFAPRMIGARYYILSAFPGEEPKPAPQPVAVQPAPQPVAVQPAPQPAAPKPAPQPVAVQPALVDEPPVAQIGFVVTGTPSVVMDKIPAATGTAIAFTIKNGTGRDAVFHVFFYKADKDFKKTKILREARAAIRDGEAREIEAYTFTEPGVYRLNVKTSDNTQLMQRTWKVVEAGR